MLRNEPESTNDDAAKDYDTPRDVAEGVNRSLRRSVNLHVPYSREGEKNCMLGFPMLPEVPFFV